MSVSFSVCIAVCVGPFRGLRSGDETNLRLSVRLFKTPRITVLCAVAIECVQNVHEIACFCKNYLKQHDKGYFLGKILKYCSHLTEAFPKILLFVNNCTQSFVAGKGQFARLV
jgi:hypothetical protein